MKISIKEYCVINCCMIMINERFVFNFFYMIFEIERSCFSENRDFYLYKMNKNYSAILLHNNYNTKIIFIFVIVQTISKEIVEDSIISTLNSIFNETKCCEKKRASLSGRNLIKIMYCYPRETRMNLRRRRDFAVWHKYQCRWEKVKTTLARYRRKNGHISHAMKSE